MSYFANAGMLLVEVLFGLAVALFVLRALLQLVRANFHNPICQFIYKASNPPLVPVRRLLKPVGRFDLAAVVVAWLLECLKVLLLWAMLGAVPAILGLLVLGFAELVQFLLTLYFWLILVGVILSLVAAGGAHHPLVPLIGQLTAPVLRPFRRVVPPLGGLDFSPMVAMLALVLARLLVAAPLGDFGAWLARG